MRNETATAQRQFEREMGFDKPFTLGAKPRGLHARPRQDTGRMFVPRAEVVGAMYVSSVKSEH